MVCYWQQWLGHICQHSVIHTIVVTFQTNTSGTYALDLCHFLEAMVLSFTKEAVSKH